MPIILIDQIVSLFQNNEDDKPLLDQKQVEFITNLTNHLHHKKLKGHNVWSKKELLELDKQEIDLARALLIYHYEDNKSAIKHYECLLDFMALEILGRLDTNASDEEKIEAINYYIFVEKGFRFPPHSMWTKSSEKFTFLSSVIDSNHGVCLGVSILYLTLAQRINVPLDIITPPGHIFLSYNDTETINIETTARGIHMDSSHYLNVGLKSLQKRSVKEVVGLNFMNAAAQNWETKQYQKAYDNYSIALSFIKDDPLLYSFMGYICLFLGKKAEGRNYLQKSLQKQPHLLFNGRLASDYLSNHASIEGIELLFEKEADSRAQLVKKYNSLKKLCKNHPKFMDARFALAAILLQLQNPKEALEQLKQYYAQEKANPIVLYYISALYQERFNTKEAREYFNQLNSILESHNHMPKEAKALKKALWPLT